MLNWKTFLCCLFATIGSIKCGEYLQADGRNYFVSYPQRLSWYLAYRYCAYHDMYLIDVGDQAENNRVLTIIDHVNKKYSVQNTDWWTSGTDLASQGKYYWAVNGQEFTYTNWATGQPDNYQTSVAGEMEHCTYLSYGQGYKWNDFTCSTKNYFVCRETLNQSSGQPTKCANASPQDH